MGDVDDSDSETWCDACRKGYGANRCAYCEARGRSPLQRERPNQAITDALDQLDAVLSKLGGCGDGNCCVHRRGGQHTNGGCKCAYRPDPAQARKLEKALRNYQTAVKAIRGAISE